MPPRCLPPATCRGAGITHGGNAGRGAPRRGGEGAVPAGGVRDPWGASHAHFCWLEKSSVSPAVPPFPIAPPPIAPPAAPLAVKAHTGDLGGARACCVVMCRASFLSRIVQRVVTRPAETFRPSARGVSCVSFSGGSGVVTLDATRRVTHHAPPPWDDAGAQRRGVGRPVYRREGDSAGARLAAGSGGGRGGLPTAWRAR